MMTDKWIQLGLGGAALYILYFAIRAYFTSQSEQVKKQNEDSRVIRADNIAIADALKGLATSLLEGNIKLTEILDRMDRRQEALLDITKDLNRNLQRGDMIKE